MTKYHQHTQIGYLTVSALLAAITCIAFILAEAGMNWIAFAVIIVLDISLIFFSSLTVTVTADIIAVRFGPGLIRHQFKLNDVLSCRVVKNSWYYGWGIHLTPHGWLYNISGFDAIEIQLKGGKKYRIGTDVPQELKQAIDQAIIK